MKLTAKEREELLKLEKQIPHKGVALRIRIILALDLGYTIEQHDKKLRQFIGTELHVIKVNI